MAVRQIILDTETTGMRAEEGHRIIEIGCIEMLDRRITHRHFHHYLNPEREIDAGAIAVHGITNAKVKDQPLFAHIASSLLEFIDGAELIIHNAPFDLSFLNREFSLSLVNWKSLTQHCRIIDTLPLARQLHPGQRNSLDALCKRYHIDNSKRDLHGALLDANLLAQVYLAMTGGQASLFDMNEPFSPVSQKSAATQAAIIKPLNQQPLHVIKATPGELAEHEQYLEHMRQQGACVWLADETRRKRSDI